ncbi:MAG: SRPBCC family protein, partial [Sulfolobaceae archaeon]
KTFTCPYHGWTYNNVGKLIGMPLREIVFKDLDIEKWGLIEIKIQQYENLIFGSEAPSISLDEYLGEAKYYLDVIFKLTGGMRPVNSPLRFIADFNWKIGAENFSEDRLHTIMTHKSVVEYGLASPLSRFGYLTPGKNEISIADLKDVNGKPVGAFGFRLVPSENIPGYFGFKLKNIENNYDERFEILRKVSHTVFTIFPNFSGFIAADSTDYPGPVKPRAPVSLLRVWQPISENRTEVWTWVIVPKEVDNETAKRVYEITVSHFGPSGAAEMDDTAIWRGITKVAGGYFANFAFTALKGGGKDLPVIKDWKGPGIVRPTQFHEECQRTFWKRWVMEMIH